MWFVILVSVLCFDHSFGQQWRIINVPSYEERCYPPPNYSYASSAVEYEESWGWPWLSALIDRESGKFFCGGSLISEQHILSGRFKFLPQKNKMFDSQLLLEYSYNQLRTVSILSTGKKPNQIKFLCSLESRIWGSSSSTKFNLPSTKLSFILVGHQLPKVLTLTFPSSCLQKRYYSQTQFFPFGFQTNNHTLSAIVVVW